MSDAENSDNGLPPKLNLSKKVVKPKLSPVTPAAKAVPGAGAPTDAPPSTSHIKLTAKPSTVKPLSAAPRAAAGAKVAPKPITAAPTPIKTATTAPGSAAQSQPATVRLKAAPRTASPATVRLKAPRKMTTKASAPKPIKQNDSGKTVQISPSSNDLGSTIQISPAPSKKDLGSTIQISPDTPKADLGSTIQISPAPSKKDLGSTIQINPDTPKADLKSTVQINPTQSGSENKGELKPKSIKLKPKAAVGIKRTSTDPNAPAGSKRSTSKISLSNANSVAPLTAPTATAKTIKIKPSSDVTNLTSQAGADDNSADVKRQTSRISLEAALGSGDGAQTSGPKTIRLKRPGKTPTVNVASTADNDDKNPRKTAKLELPDEETNVPSTQKKTIKVKRPGRSRVKKKMSVKRAGDAAEGSAGEAGSPDGSADPSIPIAPLQTLTTTSKPDSVHWTFIFSAVAATIMICVLIYVLCAQALGPNYSYTQLSYGAPTVELPWPGRLQ
jgi:hypothetical protein